jgi:hypothetical protein
MSVEEIDPLEPLLLLGAAAPGGCQGLLLLRICQRRARGLGLGGQFGRVELEQLLHLALRVEQCAAKELRGNHRYGDGKTAEHLSGG